ncbi:MAG: WD40 repeat domain-containing protein [Dehalococcoidia bacterium]
MGTPPTATWTIDAVDYGVRSVMLFDIATHQARRIQMPSNVGFAEWVKPGETFVGYDVDGSSYNVYRVDGTKVRSLFRQRLPLDHYVSRSQDGRLALVTRPGGIDLLDVDTGKIAQSLEGAFGAAISPDGKTITYVNTDPPYALPSAPHTTSLMVAERNADGVGFALPGRTLVTETTKDETFGLVYNPWSPDGRYIAIQHMATTAPNPIEVFKSDGTRVWAAPAVRGLTFATWAGPHLLYTALIDGNTTAADRAAGTLVDVAASTSTPVLLTCCAFSPDGRYAVRLHAGAGSSKQHCALFDTVTGEELAGFDSNDADRVANFCSTISWSADSTLALVSSRGG